MKKCEARSKFNNYLKAGIRSGAIYRAIPLAFPEKMRDKSRRYG
ncbi:hypothetical protein L579_3095 [Pantoea sp. AS-PWVM4]|nr:hypothetical protein L579_3095 [Pantoea sp. AS-PWVM4]